MKKPRVYILVRYFLPGYRGGGPIRTIENLLIQLGDEFEFRIITLDRDLGSSERYSGVIPNHWETVGKAKVYYLSPNLLLPLRIIKLLRTKGASVIYLNSFFDPVFSIVPSIASKMRLLRNTPVVIAPRGEFSSGAIAIKRVKKTLFIRFFYKFLSSKRTSWQASSALEKADILREVPYISQKAGNHIHTALDFPAANTQSLEYPREKSCDLTRLIFVSRICPKKNLHFALKVIAAVSINVIYDIYGPIEDDAYWGKCLSIIDSMPHNVTVRYMGELLHSEVGAKFAQYDIFLFPTAGENFGHVIHESLAAGTLPLISDQTPWGDLRGRNAGWDFPLPSLDLFVGAIENYHLFPDSVKLIMHENAKKYASSLISDSLLQDNRMVFLRQL